MGAIISRFRKEKTTYQVLENLEEQIKDIEAYTISTQAQQKRFVGNFLVVSIGLYVIAFLVFYFVFFPPTWNERIIHSLPLLISPMIITIMKKILAWYFERKVVRNTNKLKDLRAEKKKILEKVMDKETYKVAVDILNKFGDKSHKAQMQSLNVLSPPKGAPAQIMTPKGPMAQLRPQPGPFSAPGPQSMTPNRQMPVTPIGFNLNQRQQMMAAGGSGLQGSGLIQRPIGMASGTMPYRRTPYPIINHNQKGVLEKMVDYLVGDGPNSRFAMICKDCLMHNGMALQEEYEYAAFRCAFCGAFNPAKKQRPLAPRLPFEQAQLDKLSEKRGSSSSLATSEAPSEIEGGENDEGADKESDQDEVTPTEDPQPDEEDDNLIQDEPINPSSDGTPKGQEQNTLDDGKASNT
ncbi:endoplasmic reticulum junction formation protein lunapark-B [Uranotaenia lowii]|uniref:endoplasmic reticulum junction formation protein lunapark-B n=1 Tax=Uranotaenia lowii TaxID=190385 RepID=UPI00247A6506|nr:endoplasmic reticulum junction formation protein lunapark-B [Uranotaenia lowii]XP_055598898.1 endoplasmic reticulum junction formation protein lunapark-B [Uranotaenia lowii]XP_055598899.1 endoplasmic reticulum junction formation protein lunapark-B [Uranotaenia lowii]XP_055598900.1 endoplasmic reticulum junction formation protein lunapark-B [Uranotaenia lowii]XP_055598901.1 endoplasmic reticulum junction formation protein lunapark-B [Uranotaenia lowii]